jgi:hypothetical protein
MNTIWRSDVANTHRKAPVGSKARMRIGGAVGVAALLAVAALGTAGAAEATTTSTCVSSSTSVCSGGYSPAGVRWQ